MKYTTRKRLAAKRRNVKNDLQRKHTAKTRPDDVKYTQRRKRLAAKTRNVKNDLQRENTYVDSNTRSDDKNTHM